MQIAITVTGVGCRVRSWHVPDTNLTPSRRNSAAAPRMPAREARTR